jgi:hypothetical protein
MSVQGKWDLAVTRPDGTVNAALELAVQGNVVTGTSTRSDGMTTPIIDGSLDGSTLAFDIEIQQPVPARLHFELSVSGDTLIGTFTSDQVGDGKVAGKRI